jgi:hypothetical protein
VSYQLRVLVLMNLPTFNLSLTSFCHSFDLSYHTFLFTYPTTLLTSASLERLELFLDSSQSSNQISHLRLMKKDLSLLFLRIKIYHERNKFS